MKFIPQVLSAFGAMALWLAASAVPAYAQPALTNIAFVSNISNGTSFLDGAYINDTIADGFTSPLAFTLTGGLSQPFLNSSDATIALPYGTYFAISFRAFGAMVGPGKVSFDLNGTTYSQDVTFPDPTAASGIFASFSLPGGDSVTVAATGLSADRISVVPDGGGLVPDGTPDAFYLFTYGPRVINPCDVNLDNFVDVRDVQFLINQAQGGIGGGNDLNQDGVVNIVDTQIETNWVLFGCPGFIRLTLVNPNLGFTGQMNESVDVIGQSTHWVQGATTASFGGAGITVANLTVNSPISATVLLNIDPAAAVTSRNVVFTTGSEVATLANGFSVAGTPALTLVNPNTGQQSQSNESVNLTGQYTHWVQGTTTASFGGGIAGSYNLIVPGTADLWFAGRPDGTVLGGDQTSTNAAVVGWNGQNPAAGSFLKFSTTGVTDYGGCAGNSPDGDGCGNFNFGSVSGISGFNGPANALIGVFVNSNSIVAGPPAALDFTTLEAQGQATISPLLNQVFFIGDGLTGIGSGSVQQFTIPAGATQLYLGSSDAAGASYNNSGQFKVTVSGFNGVAVSSLTVNSPTTATAVLQIDSAAPAGARDVTVTTGAEAVSMSSGFTVTPGPQLLSISPLSALAGQANMAVAIVGQNTNFTNASVIDLGPGMTLSDVAATDATHLSAKLTVAGNGNLVGNGSLEDLGGFFVDGGASYMALTAGATTIAGWTVTPSTTNEIVWAHTPTADSQYAADGTYFVNLTGFGSDSPNGGITQQLLGLISGREYSFSIDTMVDTSQPVVTIGSVTVALTPGQSFQVGTDTWVPQTGTFVADSSSPVLTIANQDPSQQHCYIDKIVIAFPGSADLGLHNLTVSTGTQVESFLNAFEVDGTPVIVSVTPGSGSQTQTNAPVTITGQYTHFTQFSVVNFGGAGVTAGAATAATATRLTVPVSVGAAAALGPRQILIYSGAEAVTLSNAYTVTAAIPAVTQASPNTGPQGQQNLSVGITGQFTHWVQGTTTASFGAGVTVATLTINSASSATVVLNIDPAAVIGARNIVFTTGAEVAPLNNGFTVGIGAPVLTLIVPNTGVQGQQQEVINVTGRFTHWVEDTTGVSFGDGITPTAMNVHSPTSATVYVNIDPTAVPGPRTVSLFQDTETATLINGFTVIAGTSSLTLVSPNTGQQGQQSETVALTGQFTHWGQGATTASFGAGIAVVSLTINSATSAIAVLNIDAGAGTGARNVTLTTGAEAVTLANGFTISAPAPAITSALPGSGLRGQAFQIAITGQNTHFEQGVTKANFGSGVSAGGSVAGTPGLVTVTSATTATVSVSISASAAKGSRTILVLTGSESASLINGFAVKGTPYLSSITPNSAQPGDTLTATIHGAYTSFQQGVTTATFGAGISVGGAASGSAGPVTVSDSGDATAQLTIDPAATPGLRNPVVGTGAEQASLANSGFTVLGTVTGPPPAPTITSPNEGDAVMTQVTVTGNVDSPNLSNWVLEYQANGSTDFTQFGSGTTTTVSAAFDPSLLLNGIAQLRLTATDVSGQTGVAAANVVVAGKAKVGNYSVSFSDLTVPVAGIPIQIIRSYDSRNKASGDFGFGWTLDIQTTKVQTNGLLGDAWQGTKSGGFLSSYCVVAASTKVVTLALQGGATYTFQPALSQPCNQLFGPTNVSMIFTPTGLTPPNATLQVPDGAGLMVFGDFPGDVYLADPDTLETYDPDQFILTLPTGVQVQISKSSGVQGIVDMSGHALTFSASGIGSSSGAGVAFARDAQNRIQTITDPNGNVLTYTYSAAGDLTKVTDAMNHVSTFTYDDSHDLLSYVDATGHQPVRNVYDDSGRLIQVIDAFGNVTNLTHDMGASTETVTDALGNQTTMVYDAHGNILSVTDPMGHITTSSYDANDNILTDTDPLGHTTSFTYDANNNRLTQSDSLGNTTTMTYDASNKVLSTQDANGNTRTNAYDANSNILMTTDPAGNTTAYTYDNKGNQTSVTDALGHTSTYAYNNLGVPTAVTDPAGAVTTWAYDANGNRISQSVTRTTPAGPQVQTTLYQYDAANNLILTTNPDGATRRRTYNANLQVTSEIDELGQATSYSYDDGGRLIQITYPDGRIVTSGYDANGQRTQYVAPSGAMTNFIYDTLGRPVTAINAATGATTQTTYDAGGRKVSIADPLGRTVQYAYDSANRATSFTDPQHNVTTFTYDAAGNKTAIKDANGNTTTYQYDTNNRLTATIYPDGTSDQVAYDGNGKAISKTDAAGKTTQFAYDTKGHLLTVTDALGHVTAYAYDEVGNRISQADANGHTTTFTYDALGRRTGRSLPGGQSESMAYDSAGHVISHTDFNGKVTAYAYDTQGRVLSKTPDPSFHASPVTFTYMPSGQRASMTDPSGTSTYFYDSSDRLIQAIKPNGTTSYSYDLADNLTSIATASGTNITYGYDVRDRLSSVADAGTGVTNYTYDAVGNLLGIEYPNAVSHTYTYNKKYQLTGVAAAKGSTPVTGYNYTLDPTGRRLSVADLGGRVATYTYDSVYRLTAETIAGAPAGPNGSVSYTYDPVGNRLQTASTLAGIAAGTFTFDADDRLTSDTYDADGNTTSSGGTSNGYDFENHLIQHGAVTMVYDGDGNRVSKTAGGVTTSYLVDDMNPTGFPQVIEESGSDGSSRKLVYGLQRISQRQAAAGSSTVVTSFYAYDGHGSVRALTDAGGTVTDTYDYDAFGNIIHKTGSTPNEFLFAGEQFDADLGMYYNRARYMNPSTGRFFTMDTIDGDPQSPITLHKYLYGNGDPVSVVDPSGNEGDLSETMASIAINTTLNACISQVFATALGQNVIQWLVQQLLPPGFLYVPITQPVDAGLAGFSFSYTDGDSAKEIPFGLTIGAGVDVVIGRLGNGAVYKWTGGGITLGATGTGVGFSGYAGILWRTPISDSYSGWFKNIGIPLPNAGKMLNIVKQTYPIAAGYLGKGAGGFLTRYQSQINRALDIGFKALTWAKYGSLTLFFDPTDPFGGSMGMSLGLGAGTGDTSNISLTYSYFYQIIPWDKVQNFNAQ